MTRLSRFGYVLLGELATNPLFYAVHRGIYRLSGGRIFSRSLGCPVILLTTTGCKSGQPRTAPIFGFPEGQSVVVAPSNAGKTHYPAWYFNLRANPEAQVQMRGETRRVRAREATPEECERLWPILISRYGGYAVYRKRTDRYIPILILEQVWRGEGEACNYARMPTPSIREGHEFTRANPTPDPWISPCVIPNPSRIHQRGEGSRERPHTPSHPFHARSLAPPEKRLCSG